MARVPASVRHVHLIGVAGTAMAALAGMLAERGYRVTGSDNQFYEPTASLLRRSRVELMEGFSPAHLAPAPDLVVVGNVFLGKGRSARLRMTRELQDSIESRMKLPVVTADELRAHYLFGRRDVFRLVGFLALVVAIYALVLTHQDHVLGFLSSGWAAAGPLGKAVVAAAVFLFVPIVAFSYGVVARSLMKLIKME